MNQIKIVEIRNFLTNDDQNFKEMIKIYEGLLKQEKALTDSMIKFEKQIDQVGNREMNGQITDMFRQVSKVFLAINDTRKQYLDLLEHKIILSLKGQIEALKDKKTTLQDYEKKKQLEEKKDTALRQNNDHSKHNQLAQQLEEAKKESSTAAQNVNNKIRLYINEKNNELKGMILHQINHLLLYHAAGIEKLSELAQFICKLDDQKETQKILDMFLGTHLSQNAGSQLKQGKELSAAQQ